MIITQIQPNTDLRIAMERKKRIPLSGLGSVTFPVVDRCESGYFQIVHSGSVISESGVQIDGAVRIFRTQIKSFEVVGRVGYAEGTLVFQMTDGRFFRLIDAYNAEQYVIGYEVVPCRDKALKISCLPCPTNCKTETLNTVYYARKQRTTESDIIVKFSRKFTRCDGALTPRVDCDVSKKFGLN
ncbi:MAG: hypothetical protein IPM69_14860 [Ignavibacteria bacterium]|nr:hypothetical protein [Ignavibacteria bacterium]